MSCPSLPLGRSRSQSIIVAEPVLDMQGGPTPRQARQTGDRHRHEWQYYHLQGTVPDNTCICMGRNQYSSQNRKVKNQKPKFQRHLNWVTMCMDRYVFIIYMYSFSIVQSISNLNLGCEGKKHVLIANL